MEKGKLLKGNLDNIQHDIDLFGNKIPKLSMKDRIGFLPISIWEPDWAKVKQLKETIGDTAIARDGKTKTSYNTALGNKENNISIFNPHLAQMILSAYCPSNAYIFNPFSGDWCMGFVAVAMGHRYFGIEIRQEEVDSILARQKALDMHFEIICGDSTKPLPADNIFDFCYTCPPYYNLEVYSKLPGDLSTKGTYREFMDGIKQSLEVTYKALKPGALAVWVVGNFRNKKGHLTHFSGDTIRLAKQVGFVLHDELVFWGASKCASQRCGQFEANRKSVRVHEYIVVLKKE